MKTSYATPQTHHFDLSNYASVKLGRKKKRKPQGKVRTRKELGQDFSVSEADSAGTE